MILCKHSGIKTFEIWNPRWHDRRVLLAAHKIVEHNRVVFTKTKSLEGDFYVSGKTVKKFKKESNGQIDCYSVPLSELEPLEIKAPCEHEF